MYRQTLDQIQKRSSPSSKYVVQAPVVDLRSAPKEACYSYEKDPRQESQLLFGESVVLREEAGDWASIEAPEQPRFRLATGWTGYPGWVKKSQIVPVKKWPESNLVVQSLWADLHPLHAVSLGTTLKGLRQIDEHWVVQLPDGREAKIASSAVRSLNPPASRDAARQSILDLAYKLMGFPYLWGGRSAYRADWNQILTSVDCSGFVSLLYRVHGLIFHAMPRTSFWPLNRANSRSLKKRT